MGASFRTHLGRITGDRVKASWFDPRTGNTTPIDILPDRGDREFEPPGEPAVGNDWVLVLDDAAKAFPPPGVAVTYTNPIGDTPIRTGCEHRPYRLRRIREAKDPRADSQSAANAFRQQVKRSKWSQ
jgi:hypothetical protein